MGACVKGTICRGLAVRLLPATARLSPEDFRALFVSLDPTLTLDAHERPSAAIKRQSIDKVLLARTYAERVNRCETTLTNRTQNQVERLLETLAQAV